MKLWCEQLPSPRHRKRILLNWESVSQGQVIFLCIKIHVEYLELERQCWGYNEKNKGTQESCQGMYKEG